MVDQLLLDLESLSTFFTLVPAARMSRDVENSVNTLKSRTNIRGDGGIQHDTWEGYSLLEILWG